MATATATATAKPNPTTLKPCQICGGESCIILPSIASPQHLCLLHYYATGANRDQYRPNDTNTTSAAKNYHKEQQKKKQQKKKKSPTSLLAEANRLHHQLPAVQEIFAEAFLDLQKDVGEESARAFRSLAEAGGRAEDPLASLLDPMGGGGGGGGTMMPRRMVRPSGYRKRSTTAAATTSTTATMRRRGEEEDMEGGFLREAVLPERLRKLQNPDTNLARYAAGKYGAGSARTAAAAATTTTSMSGTKRSTTVGSSNAITKKKPSNPYQRKSNPPTNVWNHVLDSNTPISSNNNNNLNKKRIKTKFEDVERQIMNDITSSGDGTASTVPTKKCTSCNGTNIEIDGSVTSRNADVRKGEVWGMKDRGEMVVERCRCLSCGKTWNEE